MIPFRLWLDRVALRPLPKMFSPGGALARAAASAEPGEASDDVPLEIQDRLVGELYERHYRDWPDRPVPALGNRTPREAAALERRPAYDFGWMWAELGLERPGAPKA